MRYRNGTRTSNSRYSSQRPSGGVPATGWPAPRAPGRGTGPGATPGRRGRPVPARWRRSPRHGAPGSGGGGSAGRRRGGARGGHSPGRPPSRPHRRQAGPGGAGQPRHAFGLLGQHPAALLGQLVVAAVASVDDLFAGDRDQSLVGEAVERSVEGSRAESDSLFGQLPHGGGDGVPVPRPVGQRQQHEIALLSQSHDLNISDTDIYRKNEKLPLARSS